MCLNSSNRGSLTDTQVVEEKAPIFPRSSWFSGAKLNFAENLLFPAQQPDENGPAIIAASETGRERVSWIKLRERVRAMQAGMVAAGVKEGERIAGYVGHHSNALVAMLAASSLGAIWTAVSPDTGVQAVLDRMEQIEPVLLFADNANFYNGRSHSALSKVQEIAAKLPSLRAVIVLSTIPEIKVDLADIKISKGRAFTFDEFLALCTWEHDLKFEQLDPDHPLYILYSSGTTGKIQQRNDYILVRPCS